METKLFPPPHVSSGIKRAQLCMLLLINYHHHRRYNYTEACQEGFSCHLAENAVRKDGVRTTVAVASFMPHSAATAQSILFPAYLVCKSYQSKDYGIILLLMFGVGKKKH